MITILDKVTALVLIDLQKGILSNLPATTATEVLSKAQQLVEAFRRAGQPVVLVNVDPAGAPALATRKDFKPTRGPMTSEDLALSPVLGVAPDDIHITKNTWGAFFGTTLQAELKKRNVTGIVLGGVSTSIGVEGTARQASELGYNIIFAQDAMADGMPDSGARSLQYIFPRLGETDHTAAILRLLTGGAVAQGDEIAGGPAA